MELFLILGILTTLVFTGYLYMAYFNESEADEDCPLQKILNERREFII